MKGMSKTVLAVGSMTSALLLACMAAVLTATPGASQTQTVTLVGAGDIAECSPDNNAQATAPLGSTLTVTITTNSPMAVSTTLPAPTGGVSTKLTMPVLGNHEYHSSTV